jgi:hypothetical protein
MAFKWSPQNAGTIAAAGFLLLGAFQGSLVLGAPLGKASWGGGSSEIPVCFRVGSAIAAFLFVLAAATVMQRSGLKNMGFSAGFVGGETRFLTAIFFVATILNFASRSPIERWIWGPACLTLAVCCLTLARMETSSRSSFCGQQGLSEDDYLVSDASAASDQFPKMDGAACSWIRKSQLFETIL